MPPALPEPVQAVVDGAAHLGLASDAVVAVALVGSYARGTARATSDVDLVVLCDAPDALLERDEWFRFLDPHAALIGSRDFGALQERRLRLPTGLVVDVGVGTTSWAAVDPVDAGTRRVVQDGLVAVHDPDELLKRLVLAVTR